MPKDITAHTPNGEETVIHSKDMFCIGLMELVGPSRDGARTQVTMIDNNPYRVLYRTISNQHPNMYLEQRRVTETSAEILAKFREAGNQILPSVSREWPIAAKLDRWLSNIGLKL